MGVFCVERIPRGTKFGPLRGKELQRWPSDDISSCAWMLFHHQSLDATFLDTSDPQQSNWMSLVRVSSLAPNLVAGQVAGRVVFMTVNSIDADSELTVWYAPDLLQRRQEYFGEWLTFFMLLLTWLYWSWTLQRLHNCKRCQCSHSNLLS